VLPARALSVIGHEAFLNDEVLANYFDDLPISLAEDSDVVVWQRPIEDEDRLATGLRYDGLKVVEVDDDFIHLQDWSPLLVLYKEQKYAPLNNFKACLGEADLITVTTPELAELYLQYCDQIAVLPNHIELPVWSMAMYYGQQRKKPGKISIGWAGWTHGYDLDVLMGVIEKVVNDQITFTIVGWPEAARKFHCKTETHPWMPIEQYRHIVASFDIGLAPLKRERFNVGKSWLKALEYMSCGVVPIASAWHPDYSRLIEHGVDGFLAHGSKEWREYIQLLVEDTDLRMKMRSAGLAKAKKYDNESCAGLLWADAYKRAIRGPKEET
jgi:glycosyltransferase involved in cell wall biosynthesis